MNKEEMKKDCLDCIDMQIKNLQKLREYIENDKLEEAKVELGGLRIMSTILAIQYYFKEVE